jgi:hypothetical protein
MPIKLNAKLHKALEKSVQIMRLLLLRAAFEKIK